MDTNLMQEQEPLPHHLFRGIKSTDRRTWETTEVDSVSRFGLMVPLATFRAAGGFESSMSPYLEVSRHTSNRKPERKQMFASGDETRLRTQ